MSFENLALSHVVDKFSSKRAGPLLEASSVHSITDRVNGLVPYARKSESGWAASSEWFTRYVLISSSQHFFLIEKRTERRKYSVFMGDWATCMFHSVDYSCWISSDFVKPTIHTHWKICDQ